jgi:hypothetical protein
MKIDFTYSHVYVTFLLFYFFNFERLMRGNNWLVLQFVDLCGECQDMGKRWFVGASSYLWLIQKLNSESPKARPTKISELIHNPFPICFKTEKLIAFFIPSIHIYTFFNVSFSDAKSVGGIN